MMNNWWLLWFGFMFLFLVTPVTYGWGYKGWGPPFPVYVQRRQAALFPGSTGHPHHTWGRRADLIWAALAIGLVWVVVGFWWHR